MAFRKMARRKELAHYALGLVESQSHRHSGSSHMRDGVVAADHARGISCSAGPVSCEVCGFDARRECSAEVPNGLTACKSRGGHKGVIPHALQDVDSGDQLFGRSRWYTLIPFGT